MLFLVPMAEMADWIELKGAFLVPVPGLALSALTKTPESSETLAGALAWLQGEGTCASLPLSLCVPPPSLGLGLV